MREKQISFGVGKMLPRSRDDGQTGGQRHPGDFSKGVAPRKNERDEGGENAITRRMAEGLCNGVPKPIGSTLGQRPASGRQNDPLRLHRCGFGLKFEPRGSLRGLENTARVFKPYARLFGRLEQSVQD